MTTPHKAEAFLWAPRECAKSLAHPSAAVKQNDMELHLCPDDFKTKSNQVLNGHRIPAEHAHACQSFPFTGFPYHHMTPTAPLPLSIYRSIEA